VTGRVAPGWYPDYDAPPGHQRYWDGEHWTERRTTPPRRLPTRRVAGWVAVGVVTLVTVVVAVLVLTDDDRTGSSPPSGSPGATDRTDSASPTGGTEPDPGTDEVETVLDDAILQLASGAQVRLVGVTVDGDCANSALAGLVEGQVVTVTTPGPDKDPAGRLLRYVDRDGVDVGLRLIQRGVASASDDPNPRRAIYRRVDTRSPDAC
jgi:uncharacterized protein DUF2510